MKLSELKTKIRLDSDIDTTNVTDTELVGYINDAVKEAESEIHSWCEDYFLASSNITTVIGTSSYSMPSDIYANKIRKILFDDNTRKYEIIRIKNLRDLLDVEDDEDYRYIITNNTSTGVKFKLYPTAREASASNVSIWYIRNAKQAPLFDIASVADNGSGKARFATAVAHNLSTGREVYITGTTNYNTSNAVATVIDSTHFDTAQTYVSSQTGSGYANDDIDIPEFDNFVVWFAKYMCMLHKNSGNPMLGVMKEEVERQRVLMVESLKDMIVDEDNYIRGDASFYEEFDSNGGDL